MRCNLDYDYESGDWIINGAGEVNEICNVYEIPDEVIEQYRKARMAVRAMSDEIKDRAVLQGFKPGSYKTKSEEKSDGTES